MKDNENTTNNNDKGGWELIIPYLFLPCYVYGKPVTPEDYNAPTKGRIKTEEQGS